MGYVLISARGRKQGMQIPIRDKVFLIGSGRGSQIRSRRPGIGRRHCAILTRRRHLYIQDLKSGHPTHVNGQLLTPGQRVPLSAGDRVTLGPMEFVLEHRKKEPVAAPFGAPPIPVGLPAGAAHGTTRPAARSPRITVSANGSPGTPSSDGPSSWGWAVGVVALLVSAGLGTGILLSRVLFNPSEEQRAQAEPPPEFPPAPPVPEPPGNGGDNSVPPTPPSEPERTPAEKPIPPPEVKDPNPPKPPEDMPKPMPTPTPMPMPTPKPPEPKPPEPMKNQVAFARNVLPLFEARCVLCHGGEKMRGGLDVRTIESLLKGGDSGPAIVAGNPEKSSLWIRIDVAEMPPGKELSAEEKKAVRDWILGAVGGRFTP